MKSIIAFSFLFFCTTAAHAVTFDFAHIGNAGNAGDVQSQGTFGAVAYNYAISKTEVTNEQYTEFLNAVAKTDTYGLYSINMGSQTYGGITQIGTSGNYSYEVKADVGSYTYANKPVVYVSWYDSIRFTNWLHNGQDSGDTEIGAYTLETYIQGDKATPVNGLNITRNVDATYWLPSEDEWYKAAYHDASAGTAGAYFDFATGTNDEPDNFLPMDDSGNSVNHYDNGYTTGESSYPYTAVGAYGFSESSYGTYDQSGNVWEWNESRVRFNVRGMRGGSSGGTHPDILNAWIGGFSSPERGQGSVGFRVATVPEPSSLCLLVELAGGMLLRRRTW